MAVFIKFGAISVDSMENNSGVFFGENVQLGWDSHAKNNQAVGPIAGKVIFITNPINILKDPDIIDAPINDQDIEVSTAPSILKTV
ncbi:hypothetical protein SY88_07600 [Clostridiales bacterium PH28_bin88]|nr:hypothetical protein SY88_07600 [Clostridiales bacterium PH28_bin88]